MADLLTDFTEPVAETDADPSFDLLKDLDACFGEDTPKGPAVVEKLATAVNRASMKPPMMEKIREKAKAYPTPENCDKHLVVPKTNRELWGLATQPQKSHDVRLQQGQFLVTAAVSANLALADKCFAKETLVKAEVLKTATDSVTLLTAVTSELRALRRSLLRPCLKGPYAQLCAATSTDEDKPSGWLFGDDLAKAVKDITDATKVTDSLRGGKEKYPRHGQTPNTAKPYSRPQQRATARPERRTERRQPPPRSFRNTTTRSKRGEVQAGGLARSLGYWKSVTSDPVLLSMVGGLSINFTCDPWQCRYPSPVPMNDTERSFVNNEVSRLELAGVLKRVQPREGEFISNIFLRPKPEAGKFRMILNLKHLNKFIEYEHFKMESIRTVISLTETGAYMAKLDLKEAYYSAAIHPAFRKYLRFYWQGDLWEFQVLPNGLAPGPRDWTKLMKPLMAVIRSAGISIAIYIDDCFLVNPDEASLRDDIAFVIHVFNSAGLTINYTKSLLVPTRAMDFLGFSIDTNVMTVSPASKIVQKITSMGVSLLNRRQVSVQDLASFIGLCVSTMDGNKYGRLHYRSLEKQKNAVLYSTQGGYDARLKLNDRSRAQVAWWIDNVAHVFRPIFCPPVDQVMYTDASTEGWGVHMSHTETGGRWSGADHESAPHINSLELLAVLLALRSYEGYLKTKSHLQIMIDNTTAVAYVNKMGGAHSLACDAIAQQIWAWAIEHQTWLSASHIAGVLNTAADRRSRVFTDNTEWELSEEAFALVTRHFGFPEVDLFASRLNHKLPMYMSWEHDPGALAVDAFLHPWTYDLHYAYPPCSLMTRTIQKARQEQSRLIIVGPLWEAQPWFGLLSGCQYIDIPMKRDTLTLPWDRERPYMKGLRLRAWQL